MVGLPILNIPTLDDKDDVVTLESYMAELAVLYFDGTLNGSKMANLGTAGSAADGTIGNVTVDANGMNFNGTTSIITLPDIPAIQALASYTIVALVNATGYGENGIGQIIKIGAGNSNLRNVVGGNGVVSMSADTDSTDARSDTPAGFLALDTPTLLFGTYDNAGERKCRIYKAVDGEVVQATSYNPNTTATGTIVPPVGGTIGNNAANSQAWDGSIQFVAVVDGILSPTDEMLRIVELVT